MKKLFLLFVLVLLTFSKSFSQWSTDPNNNLIIGYGQDPHICSDSVGGCYVTYTYETTWYPQKLAVERIDKYGYKPWGTKKQILGELPQQWQAEIIEDGEGGVIISYEDNEWIPPYYFKTRVRVQKVDSSGNFLWSSTGVRVSVSEDTSQGGPHIVSDGEGGCVIVWQYYDNKIGINRINKLGQRVWGDSGIVLGAVSEGIDIVRASDGKYCVQVGTKILRINQNGEIINQYNSTIFAQPVPDPEGGIVLSGRVWTGMIPKLVAQRKDSLGNNLWQEPYVEIADSLGLGSFRIGVNKSTINYSWLGTYNGQTDRPFFQAMNWDGNILHENKILLSEDSSGTTIIGIIASYNDNTIFSWSIPSETDAIFAQMYDTLGNKIWEGNGIIVAHPRMINQQYTTDGRGGFIIVGLINNFTVVAQQVSMNGNLGEIITSIDNKESEIIPTETLLYQNFPNPFNSSTVINFTIPLDSYLKIELYNILGERIKTLTEGFYHQGKHSINFSSVKLSSGVYLYKMETVSGSIIKKLIIQK